MKKIVSIILAIVLVFGGNLSSLAYAQEEATSSATPVIASDPTPEPTTVPNIEPTTEPTIAPTLEPALLPFGELQVGEQSAKIREKLKVRKLAKTNFRADEKLSVIVDNTFTTDTKVKLYNVDGQQVPVVIEVVNETDPTVLSVEPNYQLRAGRYRLEITDPEGNTTTQDFTWGVLAVNTNKSIYKSSETAKLQIAVLDETGIMVCDAKLKLEIRNPKSEIQTLTTDDASIKVNPECLVKDFTLIPDYEASYTVGEEGIYNISLTAETKNGTYTINDSFEVKNSVALDVERVTATRLFPPKTYPVTFNITANEDFSGVISEKVPAIFAITPLDGTVPTSSVAASQQPVLGTLNPEIPQLGLPLEKPWPISQTFGSPPDDPVLAEKYTQFGVVGHDGVDFAADEGVAIIAVDDGEVISTNENGEYGKMVVMQHTWGRSYYGHMSEITAYVGQKRAKGFPIGMVGSSGLATGPHLHLGIKPNDADENNGYLGKINPLPYLGLVKEGENGGSYFIGTPSDGSAYTTLNWNVSLKKGESIKLGYNFKVPNISPQFYQLGAMSAKDTTGKLILEESRLWQLAVDADGSGTNSVNPSYSVVSQADNIYTFTYTATEQLGSGGIQITVPSGWSAPQGSAGTAGYVTMSASGTGYIADPATELTMEATTNWIEESGQTDPCNNGTGAPALDATNFKQASNSIVCDNSTSALPDSGDTWGYLYPSSQNWNNYTRFGVWFRTDDTISGTGVAEIGFYTSNLNTLATGGGFDLYTLNGSANLTGGTWYWLDGSLSGVTRNAITGWGIQSLASNGGTDNSVMNLDDFMVGNQSPSFAATFAGSGPWTIDVKILSSASNDTFTVVYGSGGGTSGADNSSTQGVHTFTTKSKTQSSGTLTSISVSPVITLIGSMADTMRHGNWFNSSGVEQYFVF